MYTTQGTHWLSRIHMFMCLDQHNHIMALSQLLGFDPESPFDFLPKTQEENVSSYQDKENGIQAL